MEENTVTQPEVNESVVNVEPTQDVDNNPDDNVEAQQESPEIKIPVKFNKEERELTLDEARPYLEKGMNYDKVKSRLDELSESRGLKYLNRLAEEYNTNVDDLVEKLESMDYEERVNSYADEMGITNLDHAKKLYKLEQDERARQKEAELSKAKEAKDKDMENFSTFLKNDLGLDPEKAEIDPEVWRLNEEEGVSLVDAMLRVKFKEEQKAKLAEEQNAKNSEASIGDIANQGGLDADGEITDEWLENASTAEYNRRWKDIQKYLKTKNK